MIKRGYEVTVFEALHEIGGVLKYGIPEFRLPNDVVDVEINALAALGVKFVKDCVVGKTISYDDLHEMGFRMPLDFNGLTSAEAVPLIRS